jgi:hypothetical protein
MTLGEWGEGINQAKLMYKDIDVLSLYNFSPQG